MQSLLRDRHDRSFWLTYRKHLSDIYLPEPVYLKDLYYKPPFWYNFAVALSSQQTLEDRQTFKVGFWLLALLGTDSAGNGANNYQLQLFHDRTRRAHSRTPVDVNNALGTAQKKAWLKYPLHFRSGDAVIAQFKNLTTAALTVRVTLEGRQDFGIPEVSAVAAEQPAGPAPSSKLREHLYYQPGDGLAFNEESYVALPAIGASATIVTLAVPGGMNGVIRRVGNNFVGGGWQEGSGNLVWQIQADGIPLRNQENIIGSIGTPALPTETDPIRIYEGQTISLTVKNVNVALAGQLSGGRLSGHFYPKELDQGEEWGG